MLYPIRITFGDNGILKVSLENASYSAFPFPTIFQWYKNGIAVENDTRRTYGYPNITIRHIEISDMGNYSLTAINHIPGDTPELLGTSEGSFTVDIVCELINKWSIVVSQGSLQ